MTTSEIEADFGHIECRKDVLLSRCLRVLPARASPRRVLLSTNRLRGISQRKGRRVVEKVPVGTIDQLNKQRGQQKELSRLPKEGRLDFRTCGTPTSPLKARAPGPTRAGASKLRCVLEVLIQEEELIAPTVFSDKSLNRLHLKGTFQKVSRSHRI